MHRIKFAIEMTISLAFLVAAVTACGAVAKNAWDGMWAGNCEEKTAMHAEMKRQKKDQSTIDYAYGLMVKACAKK